MRVGIESALISVGDEMKHPLITSVVGASVLTVAVVALLSQIEPKDSGYRIPDSGAPTADTGVGSSPRVIREGTWEVGVDVQAGKYKTSGPADTSLPLCYWDVRAGSPEGDIKTQGVKDEADAQGVVTLRKGEFFTTSGCKDWAPA